MSYYVMAMPAEKIGVDEPFVKFISSDHATASFMLRSSLRILVTRSASVLTRSRSTSAPVVGKLSVMTSTPSARFNSTHAASNGDCWKCGGVAHSPSSLGINRCFCALCGVVQPSKKTTPNPFDLFQLPAVFNIDMSVLDKRYKDAQRLLHPDAFSQRSGAEQAYSAEHASQLSISNKILKNAVTRAQTLLQIMGSSVGDEGDTCTDAEFLMEMMELRESVDDLLRSPSAESTKQLRSIQSQLRQQATDIERKLQKAFHPGGATEDIRHNPNQVDLAAAKNLTTRLLYVDRVFETIADKLH